MIDKYNLNLLPKGQDGDENEDIAEYDDNLEAAINIPGLGLDEMSTQEFEQMQQQQQLIQQQPQRKTPFNKKINKQFENLWDCRKTFVKPK